MRLKGYVSVRSAVPVAVQNMVIRDYCRRRGFDYALADVEFVMPGCFLMLRQMPSLLGEASGICAYSMFLMPPDAGAVLREVISAGKEFHFALENRAAKTERDIAELEALWALARLAT